MNADFEEVVSVAFARAMKLRMKTQKDEVETLLSSTFSAELSVPV